MRLVEWNGNEYEIAKRPFKLCAAGIEKKPFCDGTLAIGFQAAERCGAGL